ncbi:MAG: VTT domain-containing protein, partial [Candidatus Aenigmarchaeota archaeon]|nr:VTT domain-containing protein [Candidatus Aenigmarchaeota archaeon]
TCHASTFTDYFHAKIYAYFQGIEMITAATFLQWAQSTIATFGYAGIFIVAMISSGSVMLPTFPLSAVVILAVALKMNPILIILCAAFGSSIGELTGYFIGIGGKKIAVKKYKKELNKLEKLFQKYKGWVVITFFSFLPIIPVDVMGMFSGIIGYDVRKFYAACLAGKLMRYTFIVTVSYYGIDIALNYFNILS